MDRVHGFTHLPQSRRSPRAFLGCVLALAAATQALALPPPVKDYQKISDTEGGFEGVLYDGDQFSAVCGIGDVDGDGIADVAVGAPYDDDGGTDRGAVWILYLNEDGTVKDQRKISDTAGGLDGALRDEDHFGFAVARLGDLDGDGPAEWALAVGAIGLFPNDQWFGSGSDEALWILFMAGDDTVLGYEEIHHPLWDGGGAPDYCASGEHGFSLSSLGDLDGDGVVDLAVGSPGEGWSNHINGLSGAVRLLFLNPDGTWKSDSWIGGAWMCGVGDADSYIPLYRYDDFGSSVTTLGDLDGDGIVDLAVGASGDDDGGENRGAMYILFLNTDGTVREYQKISDTEGGFAGQLDDQDAFGRTATALGDFDGDGVVDLAVGASGDDDDGTDRGAMWLLFLNTDGTVDSYLKIPDIDGESGFDGKLDDHDYFGIASGLVGDLDGDGVPELAVGTSGDDDGGVDRGAVWVLFMNGDVAVDVDDAQPSGRTLQSRLVAGAPNPFGPRTAIQFELKQPTAASLEIYDVAGRRVRSFDLGDRPAGTGAVAWDGTDGRGRTVAPGRYLVRLATTESTDTMQLTLIR